MIIPNDKCVRISPLKGKFDKKQLNFLPDDELNQVGNNHLDSIYLLSFGNTGIGFFELTKIEEYGTIDCWINFCLPDTKYTFCGLMAMFSYVYNNYRPDRISFAVFEENIKCIRLLTRLEIVQEGIVYEGVTRESAKVARVFALTQHDFLNLRNKVNELWNGFT